MLSSNESGPMFFLQFLLDFEAQLVKFGITDEFLNEELHEKEQKLIDLYRDQYITKKLRLIEFLNSDQANPSQHSSLGKSKIIIDGKHF